MFRVARYGTRAILENPSGINNWRRTVATVTIASDTLASQQYGDVLSSNSISTSATVLIGGEYKLRATNSVTISSNFTVTKSGSLTTSTGSGALAKVLVGEKDFNPPTNPPLMVMPAVTTIDAYAIARNIHVNYSLAKESEVSCALYNLEGKRLFARTFGKQPVGNYSQKISMPKGGKQMVVFVVKAGNVIFQQAMLRE